MIGRTFSHYRIISQLGHGGMGDVYLAQDLLLSRNVALKFMAQDLVRDPHALARFLNEARAAGELSHPNIAGIFDIDEGEGRKFLVLEHVEGETLSQRIERGPLPVSEVLRVGQSLAKGLAHAHSHRIVHRDMKSANVMLTAEGEAKILDFGLARRGEVSLKTPAGAVLGSVLEQSGSEEIPGVINLPAVPRGYKLCILPHCHLKTSELALQIADTARYFRDLAEIVQAATVDLKLDVTLYPVPGTCKPEGLYPQL